MTVPDFSKIWASQSSLTPYEFSDEDYLDGWEFVGEIPPDRRMFDTLQKQNDTKLQWLYLNAANWLRKNSTKYAVGDVAFSASLPSSLVLECTTAGITAATEPDMSGAEAGGTVTDGEVVWTYRSLLGSGGDVVGTIKMYAGTGAQDGWLDCDGSAVSRALYPELFDAIGTLWGTGDGETTFNLPNAEGLVMQGASTENPVGTYKNAGLPDINGQLIAHYGTGAFAVGTYYANVAGTASAGYQMNYYSFDASRSNTIFGGSDTVQPPAACVRFMIKYE